MDFLIETGRISYSSPEGELLCEITFPETGGVADIDQTFVSDKLRGQGIASKLVSAAMNQISERGLKVRATCSYATGWLDKHKEYNEIRV